MKSLERLIARSGDQEGDSGEQERKGEGGPGGTQFRLVPSFAFIVEGTRGALWTFHIDLDSGRFHRAKVLF